MTSASSNSGDENFSHFEELKPKIYSNKAIGGFTIFFSTIFGGILLMQNLRDMQKQKEANIVLSVSALYTILTIVIVNFANTKISSLPMIMNFAGSALLTGYFSKKYFPDEAEFPKKKIWKPLIISLIITIPLISAAIYLA